MTMSMPRSLLLCCALLFACIGSPAIAWEDENGDWLATRHAIYELENMIAFLEADPQTDDGYKAPIITRARAEIRRLQAALGPPQWRWTTPCCYSRKPTYIR
jgi:hypothetical protein